MVKFDPESFLEYKAATESELESFQEFWSQPFAKTEYIALRKLRQLIQFASSANTWWQSWLRPSLDDISKASTVYEALSYLPILERATFQKHEKWLNIWMPGSQADEYSTYVTSGSTGQPVRVTNLDKTYLPTQDAVTMFEWKMWGRTNGEKLAYYTRKTENDENAIAGVPLSFLGYETPVLRINANDFVPADALRLIEKHKVTHLYTAGAQIRRLAIEQQQQKLDLSNLKQILSAGDRVDEPLREMTREVLGAEIVDRYSSEEFGYLAIQCRQGNLHALMNYNWIEILDKSGNPCQIGEVGKVVITSLQNQSSPLIRYSIGDLAAWGEGCECDSHMPVIEQISGRQSDVIRNFSGISRLMTFGLAGFRANSRIVEFQIFKLMNAVVFLAQLTESLDESEEQQIRNDIEDVFGEKVTVKIMKTDSLHWLPPEKRRELIELPVRLADVSGVDSIIDSWSKTKRN